MVGGATMPPWTDFAAASGSVYTGFASSIASHQWRIIAWFTASRATKGAPTSRPSNSFKRASSAVLSSTRAIPPALVSVSGARQAEAHHRHDLALDLVDAAAERVDLAGPHLVLDLPAHDRAGRPVLDEARGPENVEEEAVDLDELLGSVHLDGGRARRVELAALELPGHPPVHHLGRLGAGV